MLPNGKLKEKKTKVFFIGVELLILYVNIKRNILMSTIQPKGE